VLQHKKQCKYEQDNPRPKEKIALIGFLSLHKNTKNKINFEPNNGGKWSKGGRRIEF